MAELASGAVTSLLGVIRNEWRLLGRVGVDVQFIREEMESMNSFLMHLARTTPPGGEHDEQVRTWMNQVRVLAHDCNNCIDLYLYRGNPDIHLGKDRLRRYLRWFPWFLQKMLAQHRAALELSELKERARDVGKRRLRYGVEVPKKAVAPPAGPIPGAGAGAGAVPAATEGSSLVHVDGEEDGHDQVWTTPTDASGRIRRALFGLYYVLEDYLNDQLAEWIQEVQSQSRRRRRWEPNSTLCLCVAVVVPTTEREDDEPSAVALVLAREASAVGKKHVKNTILVDIPSLHIWYELGPKNILYYILREIQLQQGHGAGEVDDDDDWERKRRIRKQKRKEIDEIKDKIENLKLVDKIQKITANIEEGKADTELQRYLTKTKAAKKEDYSNVKDEIRKESSLSVLLVLLLRSAAAAEAETEKKAMPTLAECYDDIIKTTAQKLKDHMEDQINEEAQNILHNVTQYEHILREVFQTSARKRQQAQEHDTKQATSEGTQGNNQIREIVDKVKQEILGEVFTAEQVKKMIDEAKLEILQQLKEDKPDKKQAIGVPGDKGPTDSPKSKGPTVEALDEETKKGQQDTGSNLDQSEIQKARVEQDTNKTKILDPSTIEEIKKKMAHVQTKIKRQLQINGIVHKIQEYLNGAETLIILNVDDRYLSQWEQTRNALNLLPGIAVVMIMTRTETENIEAVAKEEYCYPKGEDPIDYSLAALYHGIVLEITKQQKNEYNYDRQILRTILNMCDPNELCMKIFARALYAKPKRSKEELHKLQNTLQVLPQKSYRSIAMKMFKFSYRDMPKEYQSCCLYLSIFPQGHKIRRSTLIGRWVAERMITTEDWRWSSSVHKAEQCFDALVTRGFVYSAEISATGRVKSCMVGDVAYDFITKMAKKQRIVEPRLSHHLARYFSIFSDLHLRVSDKINDFLERLSESSQWPRLKVLDLEGCRCFKNNRRYLRNICNNILLLKYLSLRGTDVNWLPHEINNLRELEVLDIQQTEVPESFTRDLLLLKLKRLLAGKNNPSPNSTGIGTSSTNHALIPRKIEKMLDMEVLINVKAKSDQDFDGIGKLWQLRKLGVVIEDKVSHLNKLLETISDLHECLWSLSITIDTTSHKGAPKDFPMVLDNIIKEKPKVLERLSISGNIHIQGRFLPSLLTDKKTPLIKVTLSNTSLSQDNLVALANLHMLQCLKLQHNTYTNDKLTFKEVQFKKLEYFLVEGSNWIEISFEEDTAAPELEKIVLSFNNIESIDGVDHLKKLEELELNKYNKGSSNSGGITDTTTTNRAPSAPADTSVANPLALPLNASAAAVVPNTPIGTDPTTSAPTGGAANPSPSPLTASTSAVANDHVANPAPSPANTTADAVNPSPSTQTTSTNHVLIPKLLSDAKQVSKVTLCGTMLKQGDLQALAKMENIRCLVLLHESYGERQLDLNKDEFPRLNVLIVNCSMVTEIKFESGSSPKLEKIVWTFAIMKSFSGIGNLTRLKELEFIGDSLPDQVKENIDKHKDTIHCTHYKPESQDQTVRSTEKGDSVPSRLHIWKDKVCCRRRN